MYRANTDENAPGNGPGARRRMACGPFLDRPLHAYYPVPQWFTSGEVAGQHSHSATHEAEDKGER